METNTEQMILEAAKELFLQKGYAMTSTADIARVAGCNTAMIHYYYRSKEQLFIAFFMREVEAFAKNFVLIPSEDLPFVQKLEHLISAHFEFIEANPRLPFLLFNELMTNPQRVDQIISVVEERVSLMVATMQNEFDYQVAQGVIRPVRALDVLINMVSLNVTTFMGLPLISRIGVSSQAEFCANRKRVIVNTILNSIIIKDDEK